MILNDQCVVFKEDISIETFSKYKFLLIDFRKLMVDCIQGECVPTFHQNVRLVFYFSNLQ
jgi:hypothetical protein